MIKSKNPSQHNTPHQEARQRVSAVARRRRAPRDRMATPLGITLSGRTKLCLFAFLLVFNFSSHFHCFSMHFNFVNKPNLG